MAAKNKSQRIDEHYFYLILVADSGKNRCLTKKVHQWEPRVIQRYLIFVVFCLKKANASDCMFLTLSYFRRL